jgi:hypothetical protein
MSNRTHPALAAAAQHALSAPSVFNTQPWQWRIEADVLELYADRDRQLSVTDPRGRLLVLSCGVALHHARISLAATGHLAEAERLPDPANPDLLARIRLTGAHWRSPDELAQYEAIAERRTDRRPYLDTPVPDATVARLRAAAEAQGARLHVVGKDQIPTFAIAVGRAGDVERADPAYREELTRWTNRPPWSGDGVPPATAVERVPRRVPVREFALWPESGMPVDPGGDRGAVYAILFGDTDEPLDWLRGGEALSAVLLTAVANFVSAAPMSDVIEVAATRELVRGLLRGDGHPYIALRFGVAAPSGEQARAPRRESTEVIEEK